MTRGRGTLRVGGSAVSGLGAYVGTWHRVEAGTPNPDFTLSIALQVDGASLTFVNLTSGMDRTVLGTVEDGYIACVLANVDGESNASPPPGVPRKSDLRVSQGGNGQLVVDLELPDGTLEPVWVHERADGVTPAP